MRLQIYIPGKTKEDLALREALKNLNSQEQRELLVLGLAAKNSTTKFSGPEFSTTKQDNQVTTGDSSEHEEVCTTKSDGENEAQEICSRNEIEPQEFSTTNFPPPSEISTTNFDTQEPEPVSEEPVASPILDEGEAAWREIVSSIEPHPPTVYDETPLPDLAKLQAITDADKKEREEERQMLAEQRQIRGPDPLEETKKYIEKAKKLWNKPKNDDNSETQ